jgi:hypothetical protein
LNTLASVWVACSSFGRIDGSNGDYKADVKFVDGTTRTIHLQQAFWVTDIAGLIPEPPKLRRAPVKAEPEPVEESSDEEGDRDAAELCDEVETLLQ